MTDTWWNELVAKHDLRDDNTPAKPALHSVMFSSLGEGWSGIITSLVDDLVQLGWNKRVGQTKSKFGSLRFYVGERTKEMDARIAEAESQAETTCQVCSNPGTKKNMRIRCDEHHENLVTY